MSDPCPHCGVDVNDLTDEIDRAHEALGAILGWANAYPLDVFPEPDFKRVHEVLRAAGLSLDCVSASNMRHVITQVAVIARQGMPADQPGRCRQHLQRRLYDRKI